MVFCLIDLGQHHYQHYRQRATARRSGISYSDDIDQAQKILEDIVSEHPLVLDEPEPTIKIDELADSSVNFICRPWVKTADFGPVRWDIIRAVKESSDQAGISIPFPQRDIHVHNATATSEHAPAQGTPEKYIKHQQTDGVTGAAGENGAV